MTIFEKEILLIPIHDKNLKHWSLFVILNLNAVINPCNKFLL